jgi:hypothetical protein
VFCIGTDGRLYELNLETGWQEHGLTDDGHKLAPLSGCVRPRGGDR